MPRKPSEKKTRGIYENTPGSGVWYIRYADENGKIQRESVGAKSLAIEVRRQRVAEADRRRQLSDEARRPVRAIPTVDEAINAYLQGAGAGKASWRDDMNHANLWKARIGGKRLDDVTPEDVEAAKAEWLRGLKPQTVKNRMSFLRRIFTLANQRGIVAGNPVTVAGMPPADPPRLRWLSEDEERELRKHLGAEDFELVELGYHTGLRRGELFGLRRENVDLARRTLSLVVGRSKKRLHEVRLNARALAVFERRLASHDGEWVFVGARGAHLDAHNWYNRVFLPALEKAGLKGGLRFHDLRHTTATILRRSGADLVDVADVLGHAGLDMTRRYAHILPDQKGELMDRLMGRAKEPEKDDPKEQTDQKTDHRSGTQHEH